MEKELKKYVPKENERYFYIDTDATVTETDFSYEFPCDILRLEVGNFFLSRLKAEQVLKKFKKLLK
jgi:hypothetical protein